jgi:hypothetical protein
VIRVKPAHHGATRVLAPVLVSLENFELSLGERDGNGGRQLIALGTRG